MSSIQKLPTELYIQIFQFLPKSDIYQCILVCKIWLVLAIPEFYKEISLTGAQIDFLQQKLSLKEDNQDQQFGYGRWVKALTSPTLMFPSDSSDSEDEDEQDDAPAEYNENDNMAGSEEEAAVVPFEDVTFEQVPKFGTQEFLYLLSCLPNLRKIDLVSNALYQFYMEILINEGTKYLQHIEEIALHPHFNEIHFNVCYNFRQTLTHLDLYYGNHSINSMSGDSLYFLPHFPNLTHLSLTNIVNATITFFDILDVCPNLVSLMFHSNFLTCDHIASNSLERLMKKFDKRVITGEDAASSSSSYPRLILNKCLKVLDLTLPVLLAPYMKYITYHTNLDTLRVTMFDAHFDDWIKSHSIRIVAPFTDRLGKIKNIYMHTVCSRSIDNEEFEELVVTEIVSFAEFGTALNRINKRA